MNYILIDSNKINPVNQFDFVVQLNQKIKIKKYIKLIQASISYDDYLIDSTNNTF